MRQKGKHFPISGWIGSVLFGGLSLLNFGLAALIVTSMSDNNTIFDSDELFGLAIFCLIYAIPFGVISLASVRLLRRGANKLSGIVYLITAIILTPVTLIMFLITFEGFVNIDALTSSPTEEIIFIIILLVPSIMSLATTLWIAILSIRVLRSKSIKAISPETFD